MMKKNSYIDRRSFILGSSLSLSCTSKVLSNNIAKKTNIVLIGGGWGGLSAAKTLRMLNKDCKITLIEKNKSFISCPISNWVIGQIKELNEISFSYNSFIKNNNINMVFDEVISIDPYRKYVATNDNKIVYDKLIISPGIQLDYSNIEGLSNVKDPSIFTAWNAGIETKVLAEKIRELKNGDNFIITIPLSPYRCPPGPYERTSLIASYIKKNKINAKIIVLDANQKVVSKGSLFKKAWKELYSDIISYNTDSQISSINIKEKKIFTNFEEFNYKFANIIPSQKAPDLLEKSGLIKKGRNWAPVNPYDFTSQYSKDIYIIGDSTDASSVGSIPKSGYVAYSMGKVAAYAAHYHLLGKLSPSPSMINTCYSLVSDREGISVSAVYHYNKEKNKIMSIKNASGLSPNRSELIALNAWDWAQAIWKDLLT
ncbi:MAG: Sulfide dehydrogenase [flavocytochrome c] flavoprotein chain [Alphaproteobacteria bacterium MarineAlpha9_Bin4]|nr:flavocytochrome C [Pelagibacterales bacterium]PPR26332.1 MAG: Sulfide dehydrogenase [flavocytochrome c] flavoprotein chain [Alphaproteobacteria bacterium MarineAlpha9_Bin4]